MKRAPRYQQTWAIQASLAIACIHMTTNTALTQQTAFNESVFKRWHEYEVFSRRIQSTARRTYSGRDPGSAKSYPIKYQQNRQCALFCANMGWDKPEFEFCLIANSRYSAEIKRNLSDHSNTLLMDYKEDPNASFPSAGRLPLPDLLFAAVSPHFTYRHVRLSDVVLRPSFKVNGVSKEMYDGNELIRIDHSYVEDLLHPNAKGEYRRRGSIYFDPTRCWCIRQIKESEELIRNGSRVSLQELDIRYKIIDHPSGFPIIKSRTEVRTGYSDQLQRKIAGTLTEDYETEVNVDVPNEEFTLSAFGLPEPAGMEPVKKPIPMYIWILGAAGICGLIALAFRYLVRRRGVGSTA